MPGLDPSKLRPGEAVRLLNSTPLGTVLDGRRLRRHRDLAGYRIGDGSTVDLFRYAAWPPVPGGVHVRLQVRNRCSDFNGYRAARVNGLFNAESGANFSLDADLSRPSSTSHHSTPAPTTAATLSVDPCRLYRHE